jgi:ABC-type branched-subunit amino acid transport system ATPase component
MSGDGPADGLISIRDVEKHFGGVVALDGVNLALPRGEILGLIGPNGAGKTTLMNVITGVLDPTSGEIVFDGKDVTGLAPYQITNRGLLRTFQETRHFEDFDAFENVRTGLIENRIVSTETFMSGFVSEIREESQQEVSEAIRLVGLSEDDLEKLPSDMTHLERTKLSMARASVHDPKLMLLDEPLAGLAAEEIQEVAAVIETLNANGITILLIDHNVSHVVDVADRVAVLDQGSILTDGDPETIVEDEEVRKAYFGE